MELVLTRLNIFELVMRLGCRTSLEPARARSAIVIGSANAVALLANYTPLWSLSSVHAFNC